MKSRRLGWWLGAGLLALVLGATSANATLVAFYPFEGNASDASGNGNNGTVYNGAALTASGYEGQAYDFDGANDYISIPVNLNPSVFPKMTMGAWANTDVVNAIRAIISHDNGGYDRTLNVDWRGPGSGYRYSAFTGSGVTSAGPDPAPIGEWVFVAARYDDVANTLTLDVGTSRITVSANPGAGNTTARIGSNPCCGEYFNGRIDNVFIYNELLTDAQIDAIRTGGENAILPPAVPEPSTLLLLGSCLAGLSGLAWRRRYRE